MKLLGKILVIFTVAVSLAFLGFVGATNIGGVNWNAEMQSDDLGDYVFTPATPGTTTYSVRSRDATKQFSKSGESLAAVVVAARDQKVKNQQQEVGALDQQIEAAKAQLASAEQTIPLDIAAIGKRIEEIKQQQAAMQAQIDELNNQAQQQAQLAYNTRAEASKRRDDVVRLQAQLDELRTDRQRAEDLREKLERRLIEYQGQLASVTRRNEQLRAAKDPGYNAPPTQE